MIYQEFLLRLDLGEVPRPEEYTRRFPALKELLVRQFAIDRAMREANATSENPARDDLRHSDDDTEGMAAVNDPGPHNCRSFPSFPGLELIELLGRGAMGVVFMARSTQLGRIVAVKTITEFEPAEPNQSARFLDEARAAARLQHPNIVTVHEIGEHGGRPYFVQEFVDGGDLKNQLGDKPMPVRASAELLEILSRAVHAAHLAGIVHRDLKPSNILLTADGVPKVADFGLAKLLGGDSARTQSGQVIGTPSYMAPEQAEGRSKEVSATADVYALGAILYETLTGRPPFWGVSQIETLKLVCTTEPVSPKRLRPDLPRDPETICLKCLEKQPSKRYASAMALADDLKRYLDGRPITARPVGPAGRLRRWAWRNPGIAGLSAAVVAALVVGAAVSGVLTVRATRAERSARTAAENARKERDRAERALNEVFSAVQAIVLTDKEEIQTEEALPFRTALLDEGLRLSRQVLQHAEGDARAVKLRAQALTMESKILGQKGDRAGSEAAGKQAVELLERLVARDPADVDNRAWLAQHLFVFATKSTTMQARRSSALRSTEIYLALLRENPHSPQAPHWACSVANNFHNIGNEYFVESLRASVETRSDLLHQAIEALREGRRLWEEWIEQKDRREDRLQPRAFINRYLCRAYLHEAKLLKDPRLQSTAREESILCGKLAVADFQAIADQLPGIYHRGWDLHEAVRELGVAFASLERWDEAIEAHEKARETVALLAKRHGTVLSRMAQIQEDIAIDDYNLIEAMGNNQAAHENRIRELVDEAYTICEKLSGLRPLSRNLRQVYAYTSFLKANKITESTGVAEVELNRQAARFYESVVSEDPADLDARQFLLIAKLELGDGLASRSQIDESKKVGNDALLITKGYPEVIFETARLYATESRDVIKSATKLDPVLRDRLRQRYSGHVIPLLRDAVAAGFNDVGRIRHDPTFGPFQSNPEFRSIVSDLAFPADPLARE